ncbi:hypothetical protein ACQP1W_26025 [Spirillospora sp. CA-255316]
MTPGQDTHLPVPHLMVEPEPGDQHDRRTTADILDVQPDVAIDLYWTMMGV